MEDFSFEKEENALEGNVLSTLDPMKRNTIIEFFDNVEAEGALKKLTESGNILANLQLKEIVDYLRQSGVTETKPIRWL